MKCPHCNTGIHKNLAEITLREDPQAALPEGGSSPSGRWMATHQRCPECGQVMIFLRRVAQYSPVPQFLAYPKGYTRPISPEVVDPYRQDFSEACLVLADSPKASAALSRRCLQMILKDKGGAKEKDLVDQIDEVVPKVPSHIASDLDAVRVIGNFAAHPIKSTNTGEIVEIEPNEAEWNLDVVESLFDFYFVQPAIAAKRKSDLNKKLKDAGKPELP
ncbi:MAG: DUF4145 domain-containing protein [Candidatus Sulfotelmatobacter sp.]